MDARSEFLIVGSGIAALRAALELAATGDVLVLTKASSSEGNTGYAQGGIAAAVGDDDSPDLHARDTIAAGDGLCDEAAVRVLCESGPADVAELLSWGAAFDRDPDRRPALTREAAHSVRRVLHARDATGREIGRILWQVASARPRIRVVEHTRALSLIVDRGVCAGVRFLQRDGSVLETRAPATLIATGGAGQVYRETTNPEVASGDGVAMAYLAGARVADLEFVQFHPTALDVPGMPRFLLSEALRGEGARLVNADGDPFMTRYETAGDLAPRDRVSRGIVREMERTGAAVFLSMRHLDAAAVHARFPLISAACRKAGLDLAHDLIPVSPAAHYVMGGVETDLDGRTSVPGLFAAGEVACTGVHGANRLASNSLLEGLVFGRRAGAAMREHVASASAQWPVAFRSHLVEAQPAWAGPGALSEISEPSDTDIRERMWRAAGVVRDGASLSSALRVFEAAQAWALTRRGPATARAAHSASLAVVAGLMTRAALRREESRGAHFRLDFPRRDDAQWGHRVAERLAAPIADGEDAARIGVGSLFT